MQNFIPDYAARKFAEGARRRTMVLQMPDPAASRDKFGEIASPLWLQMPNVFAVGACHHLSEKLLCVIFTIIY